MKSLQYIVICSLLAFYWCCAGPAHSQPGVDSQVDINFTPLANGSLQVDVVHDPSLAVDFAQTLPVSKSWRWNNKIVDTGVYSSDSLVGTTRQFQFDPTPLIAQLRDAGIAWLTVSVIRAEMPFVECANSYYYPSRQASKRVWYRAISTDDNRPTPIAVTYGFKSNDFVKAFVGLGIVLFIPVLIVYYCLRACQKSVDDVSIDAVGLHYKLVQVLNILSLLIWIIWSGVILAVDAWPLTSFYAGSNALRSTSLILLMGLLPVVTICACYGVAYPGLKVFTDAKLSRLETVGHGLLSQAKIVMILCVLVGINETISNLSVGIYWILVVMVISMTIPALTFWITGLSKEALNTGEVYNKAIQLAECSNVKLRHFYYLKTGKMRTANAFAMQSNSVAFTDILLENLSRTETDFTIAHEITHLKKRHQIRIGSLYVLVVVCSMILDYVLQEAGMNNEIRGLGRSVSLGIGILAINYVCRRFELNADSGAIALTNDPASGITSLIKITRLNYQPLHWNKSTGVWLKHPTTEFRVSKLAEKFGVDDSRLALLKSTLDETSGADSYSVQDHVEPNLLFSTAFRTNLIQFISFVDTIVCIGLSLLLATYFLHSELSRTVIKSVLALSIVGIFLLSGFIGRWIATQYYFKLRDKLNQELIKNAAIPAGASSEFVTFSPTNIPCIYEGLIDWDLGFLFFDAGGLHYVGERTSFVLSAQNMMDVKIVTDIPSWRKIRQIEIDLVDPADPSDENLGNRQSFRLRVCVSRRQAQATQELFDRIKSWCVEPQSTNTASEIQNSPPKPEDVPSLSYTEVRSTRPFLRAILFQLSMGVVLCSLTGLLDHNLNYLNLYVVFVAPIIITVNYIPIWRYQFRIKRR